MRSVAHGLLTFAAIAHAAACASSSTKMESQVAIVKEEQSPDKLLARGRVFARIGDYTRAEQYLAAALDAGAEAKVVLPLLLRACLAEQRYRAAIAYAEPQLEKKPDDFKLRFVLGSLYAAIGDTAEAREHLSQVVKERPDYAEVHFAMGRLALDAEGDRVAADGHFREYLRLMPDGSHAEEARGYLLRTVP